MSWKQLRLDEMGEVSRGKSKHRPRNDPKLYGGSYPFIQTADVKNADFYITDYRQTYNEVGLAQSKIWPADTLCITIAANIADTAILAFPACFPDSVMGFIPDTNICSSHYIKYCFDIMQAQCKQISQGTAQDNLSWERLSTIKFFCPPLDVQKRVTDILSSYDKLIENSRRQIALLEEAAQRLYKEWFVDLRFPGHETTPIIDGLPEGWKKVALESFIESHIGGGWGSETSTSDFNVEAFVVRATDISDINNGNLSLPLRWHKESNFRTRSLAEGDIVFEVSGGSKEIGVGRSMIVSKQFLKALDRPVICASFCKKIRCRSVSDAHLLYEQIQMDLTAGVIRKYEKRSAGNIINFHWEDFLKSYQVIVPDDDTLNLFSIQISCIRKQAENCKMLCLLAKEARDRLLPKLMSGEIEVG